jgi:hypothetical protein
MQNFGIIGRLLKIPHLSAQECHSAGVGGVSYFWGIGILICLLLRSLGKISEPYDNPFWDFSNDGLKKKKKRI